MLALRSAPPVISDVEAEDIAREVYGRDLSMRRLPGERDCNFHGLDADGSEYVLKVLGADAADATDCQASVLRHLAAHDPDLPVPRVQPSLQGADLGSIDRDARYATCLLTYLPGRPLADCTIDMALLDQMGRLLARMDRALRGFFHPALARCIAWDVRRLPELTDYAADIESAEVRRNVERVIAAVARALPMLTGLRGQAIHGDCHAGNLLMDAQGALGGILDFGDMIHAPLILEPAVAMSELLAGGLAQPEALSSLLEGYGRVLELEAVDIEALYDLVTGRHAATLLVHAWRRRHDPAGARLLDASAANAGPSLDGLLGMRTRLLRQWHQIAGTAIGPSSVDLGRRHRLLGAGAELFYEQPLHLERGAGVWLYDPAGRAYLDGYNNVPHVGHAHPTVVRAIQRQTAMLTTHTRYLHARILDYAEQLVARCPPSLDACIFVNSGSEANDVAWRLAQFATGRRGGMVMEHAYHGITDAVAALTPGAGQPRDARVVTLRVPPDGCRLDTAFTAAQLAAVEDDAERALRALTVQGLSPAAFFLDTALTSSGIFDPPPAWARAVANRVRAAGGLIVADEVQYGLGRSGSHGWGFERRGLAPDMITLGKPIGNGYPMGAVIANRSLIEAFQREFGFFSTFGGSPVAAAAGLAVLQVLDRERLTDNAMTTGAHLRRRLETLAAERACLGAVRGAGLLVGVEVRVPGGDSPSAPAGRGKALAHEIVNALAAHHRVLIGTEGPRADILKIRPPMVFRPEHADVLVEAIAAATAAIDGRRA